MAVNPTESEVRELAKVSGVCVSIYMPTATTGRERLEGPVRFKNECVKAHDLLVEGGMRSTIAWDLLEPAKTLTEGEDFWTTPYEGLAMFFTPESFKWYRTPFEVPELTVVGTRFHVRPLLPVLEVEPGYVLAMDEKHARLIRVFGGESHEVEVPGMPRSLEEAIGPEFSEKQRQSHSVNIGGHPTSVSHGAGDQGAEQKDKDLRYCQALDRAIVRFLARSKAPLIIAATEPILSVYRNASHYDHLAEESLPGWPGRKSDEDLAREAQGVMHHIHDKKAQGALRHWSELRPVGKTLSGVENLIPAAISGKVETMLSDKHALRWGFVDAEGKVRVLPKQDPGSEDLINRAAIQTLADGGHVIEMEDEPQLQEAGALGTLRY